jgi:excisionase family DNA binding protein
MLSFHLRYLLVRKSDLRVSDNRHACQTDAMNATDIGPRFLTIREAAALLRVSTTTAYRLARTGELPTVPVGGQFRIPADELFAKLGETRTGSP